MTKIAFPYVDYKKVATSFVPKEKVLKPKMQKESIDFNTTSFESFTEEDEVLRLKRREKIRDKRIEEISESLQQARENIDNIHAEITKVKE